MPPEMTEQEKLLLELARQGDAELAALRAEVDTKAELVARTTGRLMLALDRAEKAEADNARLRVAREAKCGKCGRDVTPAGDCYGCEVDRLRGELEQERTRNRNNVGIADLEIKNLKADNARLRPTLELVAGYLRGIRFVLRGSTDFASYAQQLSEVLTQTEAALAPAAETKDVIPEYGDGFGRNGTAILGEGKPAEPRGEEKKP